jgi:hypothetical protein
VTGLLTIGGDDTAYSAMKVEERAAGRIHVVHVPKTIDNDLDLPPAVDTFGFQTARHFGAEVSGFGVHANVAVGPPNVVGTSPFKATSNIKDQSLGAAITISSAVNVSMTRIGPWHFGHSGTAV